MEGRGLVGGASCGTDRRGAFVAHHAGREAAIEAAAPAHVAEVRRRSSTG